jgi:hypothetical protein
MSAAELQRESAFLSGSNLLTGEKLRGALAGVLTGSTASGLNWLAIGSLGLSTPVSAVLFLYLFGGMLGYSLDIVLAKREFLDPATQQAIPVPYSAVGQRLLWLLGSFAGQTFFRFVATLIIETLTGVAVLQAVLAYMDRKKLWAEPQRSRKLRDAAVSVGVAAAVFVLFGNILRFDWAYNEAAHPLLNMVVLMWMALSMLAFASSREASPPGTPLSSHAR